MYMLRVRKRCFSVIYAPIYTLHIQSKSEDMKLINDNITASHFQTSCCLCVSSCVCCRFSSSFLCCSPYKLRIQEVKLNRATPPQRPHYAGEISENSFISTVSLTAHTNPSQKQSFSKTPFKPDECEIAGFSLWGVDGKHF